MIQVEILHTNVSTLLYECGICQHLNKGRVAANAVGGLGGLHFSDDYDETMHHYDITEHTWQEYFSTIAVLTLVAQTSEVTTFDRGLEWAISRVLPARLDNINVEEACTSFSTLLLSAIAQENAREMERLHELRWHNLVAVNTHHYMTSLTFGHDVRIARYMELCDDYKQGGGKPVHFTPATYIHDVSSLVRGFAPVDGVRMPRVRAHTR